MRILAYAYRSRSMFQCVYFNHNQDAMMVAWSDPAEVINVQITIATLKMCSAV